jgi:SulP family sulfate permease
MTDNRIKRFFPFMAWLPLIDRGALRADLLAGLTGAVLVLPQGVAFATIAGMPPEYGLYAGMVPAIVAALFGSSHHLVSGPTTAASIVLFSGLSVFAEPGSAQYVQLALTLTVMVGVIQLAMGVARLGVLVNFISHSVVVGFTAGAALLIAANQLKHFFGIDIPRGGHLHETVWHLFRNIAEIHPWVTLVGVLTLASGILIKRFWPRFPYMLGAMLLGSLAAALFDLLVGHQATGIATVGALPRALPPLSAPLFDLHTIKQLAPVALAATLFALTEAVSIARSIAARSGQHVDGNQEFIGQGLSNVAGSFFSGYVATGSFNRSGLNYQSGAKTPLAAVLGGVFLMGVVLAVAPYAAYLPNAAMAGILFLVAWGLIDFHHIRTILRTNRSDSSVMIVTFLSTLFLELEFAIFFGVILSLVLYLARTSRPRIHVRVPDPRQPRRKFVTDPNLPECPQLKILRIDGSLFFGAVAHVNDFLRRLRGRCPEQKHLMVVASGINFVDAAGADLLSSEAEARRNCGGGLYLVRIKGGVCEPIERGRYLDEIGAENTFEGKGEAIENVVTRLDPAVCEHCTARIFRECASLPGAPRS